MSHPFFTLHFEWAGEMSTSLHKHRGWELVLVRSGELNGVVDGRRGTVRAKEFMDLPAGSVHAIWSSKPTAFDVVGQRGLGLTVVVPAEDGSVREVPIYLRDGPWATRPPRGVPYTAEDQLDALRRASLQLLHP